MTEDEEARMWKSISESKARLDVLDRLLFGNGNQKGSLDGRLGIAEDFMEAWKQRMPELATKADLAALVTSVSNEKKERKSKLHWWIMAGMAFAGVASKLLDLVI